MDKFDELVNDVKVLKKDDVIIRFGYLLGNPALIVVLGTEERAMKLYEVLRKEIENVSVFKDS